MTLAESRHHLTLVHVAATTLALLGAVMLIRGRIVGVLTKSSLAEPVSSLATMVAASFYDIAFIVSGAILFMALSLLARDNARYQRWLSRSYLALSLVLLVLYIFHISVMKFLFKPFTYQWLYYSEFLGSLEAHQAIAANFSIDLLAVAGGLVGLFLLARWFAVRVLLKLCKGPTAATAGFAALVVSMLLTSAMLAARNNIPYSQTAQPVVAFVASLPFGSESIIHTAQASPDVSDFVPPVPAASGRAAHGVRNVIFYVMESVAAEYVGLYGSTLGATPELDRRKNKSLIISDGYAHSPTTTMSLVSLLTGTYPWVAQRLVTTEFPDIGLTSISSLLKARGYRTGMFYASDLRFQKTGIFVSHRHFDRAYDFRTMPCNSSPYANGSIGSFSSLRWDHLDGIKDECAVQALTDFIEEAPSEPFFSVLWTNQSHYPYFLDTQEARFAVQDRDQNRYLNTVRAADRELGKLFERLEARGLLNSTLVVVLGDHGEAFGRHGDRGHGGAVYEANIKIPLVFINRKLFRGRNSRYSRRDCRHRPDCLRDHWCAAW